MSKFHMLINGKLVDGDGVLTVRNPATDSVLAECPRASADQLDAAVLAAKTAFPSWAAASLQHRRTLILKAADAMEAQIDALARLLTQEQGKPLAEATAEIAYSVAFTRHLAGYDLPMKLIENSETRRVELHRKPLGVVAAIIPWNFPVLVIAFKFPLALLAGNTIVIKPAPTTPLTALKLGELFAEIFPPGVVNIIVDDNDLGDRLTSHPDVAKITFTGSTVTGRKVMSSAAATLKRLTLELGGNDPCLVFEDADPKAAAQGVFDAAFMNAGQVCLAIKRVYAHEKVYDAFCDELADLANKAVVGDGLEQGVTIGPVQNRAQFEKVKGFLADAHANGKVIAGGDVDDRPGYFIRPTIVRDIVDGTMLVDEEQFGPILPVVKVGDMAEAVTLANASPYGLGASLWGADAARLYDVAQQIEAGTVWINKHLDFGPNIPFGGAKQSGVGVEFAEEGLAEFTQVRVVNIAA